MTGAGPVVIVGGGLAGAAAAARLARAHRAVLLIERETEPVDKICGEFLSEEAQRYLARIGLDVAALGGHPITHLRLVRGRHAAAVRLPFHGTGLSRRLLDEALLAHAAAAGAEVRRGVRVQVQADEDAGGQTVAPLLLQAAGVGELRPHTLLLATGKHDLRGLRRAVSDEPEDLVGFKTYFRLAPAQARELAHHVEVLMFEHGYAGLQPVEGGRANLCLLVQRTHLQDCGGDWPALLEALQRECQHLWRRLHDAAPLLERPLAIFRVPYGFVHRPQPADAPNVFRLGDQMGVIPSFSGDGMSIALHSAALAADAVLAGAPARAYHERMLGDIAGQIARAVALYRIGRRPVAQRLVVAGARVWPRAVQWAAASTRVPPAALARGLGA